MRAEYDVLLDALLQACHRHYGRRLVSLAVFGSVGRGTPRHDSDIDLLIVAEPLPDGRLARAAAFQAVERELGAALAGARRAGLSPVLSPVFKTPAEVDQGSPLFLDMVDDARVLHDSGDFLKGALERLRQRLARLGARRIWKGNAWIWDLKPDYRPGEVFEL
jgi:uncharacterized protein